MIVTRDDGRITVMGVLNVTPDSFSDGGRFTTLDDAVAWGIRLREAGADYVDVGGESTRPGAQRVDAATETARVVPVIKELTQSGVPVSIDTTRAAVAQASIAAGAVIVNDVSGGLADPEMASLVRDAQCPWILMHWRGHSEVMAQLASYDDVVSDVTNELMLRVDAAIAAGVSPAQLVLDPGIGFAKTPAHDWSLLAHLHRLTVLGFPVLVGASRKSFLGKLLGTDGVPRPVSEREDATTAITTAAALSGVWGVRVHDVRASSDAASVVAALNAMKNKGESFDRKGEE
jgi:dihydropteroate synthase